MFVQKRIMIIALLVIDGMISTSILRNDPTPQTIVKLMFVNAALAGPACLTYFLISKNIIGTRIGTITGFKRALSGNRRKKSKQIHAGRSFVTKNGEKVKNMGELKIAAFLNSKQIEYGYEILPNSTSNKRVKRTGFYLNGYSAYLLYRTKRQVPESAHGGISEEQEAWRNFRASEPDLKFFFVTPKDLNELDPFLNSFLSNLKSLEVVA